MMNSLYIPQSVSLVTGTRTITNYKTYLAPVMLLGMLGILVAATVIVYGWETALITWALAASITSILGGGIVSMTPKAPRA
jgi:uncharacterized membrane protein